MERTFDTPKPVRLMVENESGLVTVHAVSAVATTVSVLAETPGAEELVERTTVECRSLGDTTRSWSRSRASTGSASGAATRSACASSCRWAATSTVTTAAADIEVTGTVGAAELKTASGDVSTDDIDDGLRAITASGNVIVGTVSGHASHALGLGQPALHPGHGSGRLRVHLG